jgi:hypothetical protein
MVAAAGEIDFAALDAGDLSPARRWKCEDLREILRKLKTDRGSPQVDGPVNGIRV